MKRKLILLFLIASISPLGCAEFEGYYDDNNRDNYRMTNWSDTAVPSDSQKETPSAGSNSANTPRN